MPVLGCKSNNECGNDEICREGNCVNPCIVANPCATTANCEVNTHRLTCTCPSGTTGDPFTNCYASKWEATTCVKQITKTSLIFLYIKCTASSGRNVHKLLETAVHFLCKKRYVNCSKILGQVKGRGVRWLGKKWMYFICKTGLLYGIELPKNRLKQIYSWQKLN